MYIPNKGPLSARAFFVAHARLAATDRDFRRIFSEMDEEG
jgi:hypothetical protein